MDYSKTDTDNNNNNIIEKDKSTDSIYEEGEIPPLFEPCPFYGCNVMVQSTYLEEHKEDCENAIIKCNYCKRNDILKKTIKIHYKQCLLEIIKCDQCFIGIQRDKLDQHIDNECPKTMVPCKFKEFGCKDMIERSELPNHLLQQIHLIYMMNKIDQQSEQLNQKSLELFELNKKYDKLVGRLDRFENSVKSHWSVSNAPKLLDYEANVGIDSKPFNIGDHTLWFKLFPKYEISETDEVVALFIYHSDDINTSHISLHITIINENSSFKNKKQSFLSSETNSINGLGWNCLKSSELQKGWISNKDKFTIKFTIVSDCNT